MKIQRMPLWIPWRMRMLWRRLWAKQEGTVFSLRLPRKKARRTIGRTMTRNTKERDAAFLPWANPSD